MEKVRTKTKKLVQARGLSKRVKMAKEKSSIKLLQHNHGPMMGTGPCKVAGCGCPGYKGSEGTCFNLNSAGGTCNHLESDHASQYSV